MTPPQANRLPPYSSADAGEEIRHCAFQVLRRHPRLALYPIVTACGTVAILAFFTSVWGAPRDHEVPAAFRWFDPEAFRAHPLAGGVLYLVGLFVATFANVAFYHETMAVFAGRQPSVARGVAFACRRVGGIAAWTAFAGTVGILLHYLSEKVPWVGRLVLTLVGITWSIATIFAVPVLVRDGQGDPRQVLRISGKLVRQTWGELVYGFVRFWFVPATLLAAFFLAALLVIPGVLLVKTDHAFILWANAIFTGILALSLAVGLTAQVVRSIYVCALYVYATEGVVPLPFTPAHMDAAWKIKGG